MTTTNHRETSYPPGTRFRFVPDGMTFAYKYSVTSHGGTYHHGNVVDAGDSHEPVGKPVMRRAERCEEVGE